MRKHKPALCVTSQQSEVYLKNKNKLSACANQYCVSSFGRVGVELERKGDRMPLCQRVQIMKTRSKNIISFFFPGIRWSWKPHPCILFYRQVPENSEPERILDLRPRGSVITVCIIQCTLHLIWAKNYGQNLPSMALRLSLSWGNAQMQNCFDRKSRTHVANCIAAPSLLFKQPLEQQVTGVLPGGYILRVKGFGSR